MLAVMHSASIILALQGTVRRLLFQVSLLLWCAVPSVLASPVLQAPELPPDTALSDKAGREQGIILKLRLGTGNEFPCLLDTGSSVTILNPSLAPWLGASLGSHRLGRPLQGATKRENVFQAPDLYLGGVKLRTGPTVLTGDTFGTPTCPIQGVLGMDCLSNYCIQLDFAASRLRFLRSSDLTNANLGKRFFLNQLEGTPLVDLNLSTGRSVRLMVDSGFSPIVDATLPTSILQPALRRQIALPTAWSLDLGSGARIDVCPVLGINGQIYKDVLLAEITIHRASPFGVFGLKAVPLQGWITLKFLARHRATFDFPNHALYLQPNDTNQP